MLAALRRQEPDHVPFWSLWRNKDVPFRYGDQVERAEGVSLDDIRAKTEAPFAVA